jgi:hypothetical protein
MSATKGSTLTKEKRYEQMRDGTLYLKLLLEAVDPAKLRKRRVSGKRNTAKAK